MTGSPFQTGISISRISEGSAQLLSELAALRQKHLAAVESLLQAIAAIAFKRTSTTSSDARISTLRRLIPLAWAVIAPALVPRRPEDRIKTDRRDAGQLAVLYRAGALTAIHIPTEQEQAARDLLRCREDIRADVLRARHRLSKVLLRHGRRFTGTKKAWSKRHDSWLRQQTWPIAALDQVNARDARAIAERNRATQCLVEDAKVLYRRCRCERYNRSDPVA